RPPFTFERWPPRPALRGQVRSSSRHFSHVCKICGLSCSAYPVACVVQSDSARGWIRQRSCGVRQRITEEYQVFRNMVKSSPSHHYAMLLRKAPLPSIAFASGTFVVCLFDRDFGWRGCVKCYAGATRSPALTVIPGSSFCDLRLGTDRFPSMPP